MTRHPTSRRPPAISSGPDDVVIAKVVEASAWTRNHSRAVIVGLIILGIAVFAAVQYVNYRAELRGRAATELLEVRQTVASGDFPSAVNRLEDFIERFGGTPAAAEARLLLGQLQLAQGNAAQAVEAIRPLADEGDDMIASSAGLLLAGAYEAAGQPEQAEQAYLRVAADAALDFQQREALEDAARIRAERGDAAGAIELYDRLIALTEEGSAERDVYEMRRTEIATASRSGS
ncbi:MAG TPA: tetratricopeptide repeat protein [Longimicrobiales bacterium]|nr:tetratricopeptide repeat protein [Longimicrobiales bacterium]